MKFGKSSLYTIWMGVLGVAVIACLFTLIFASCSHGNDMSAVDSKPGNTQAVETDAPAQQAPAAPAENPVVDVPAVSVGARLAETADAGVAYQDKFIFLGDSTTYGLMYYGMLTGGNDTKQVWTPSNGTLTLAYWSTTNILYPDTGEEISITSAVEQKKPEYMLITLGVNGISFMDRDFFVTSYRDLINAIQAASPSTKIIINSIYPVASGYQHLDQINNDKICAANAWLEELANEKGIAFLNCYDSLRGDDSFLKNEYQNGDYIHLNDAGFQVVLKELRTHEYK